MSESTSDHDHDYKALEEFVVNNDALLELETRVGRFNIFDALGIVHAEIRHSNFLAWLLDPGESHGLGGLFLKAVLMDLLRQTPADHRLFSPILLDGGELHGIEVRREWKNIDLLIVCNEPKFVIAIENKIRAGTYNPFDKYKAAVDQQFPDHKRMYVLLGLEEVGMEDHPQWVPYTYPQLRDVLQRVRKANDGILSDDVGAFLDHYLRLIGSRLMEDENIVELCREIYKNHRQAIDLINDHVTSPAATATRVIAELVEKTPGWKLVNMTTKVVAVIPDSWQEMLPAIGTRKKFDSSIWLVLLFLVRPKGCKSVVQVWPTSDTTIRQQVIERITEDPKEFGLKTFFKEDANMGQKFTVFGRQQVDSWGKQGEVDEDVLREKVKRYLEKRGRELDGIADALREIVGNQL